MFTFCSHYWQYISITLKKNNYCHLYKNDFRKNWRPSTIENTDTKYEHCLVFFCETNFMNLYKIGQGRTKPNNNSCPFIMIPVIRKFNQLNIMSVSLHMYYGFLEIRLCFKEMFSFKTLNKISLKKRFMALHHL